MSSSPETAAKPPSVFISYASADRNAARALTETLTAAGLEIWLDEEELAGGEAWDAKIRKQIRSCTYFIPVISATTEARREGYFRREWRLAVERTLDLADDVMFLVPVVIDETRDHGARVPEKFLTVQWLRCPGGRETPQLLALARKLAAEHSAPVAALPPVTAPPPKTDRLSRKAKAPPPPFPEFPAFPAPGHRVRFVYDVVVWSGRMIYSLWPHLPRWLRLLAMVIIVMRVIGLIFRDGRPDNDSAKHVVAQKLGQAFSQPDENGGEIAQKILAATGAALDTFQGGRPLALVAFTTTDSTLQAPAVRVLAALREQLAKAGHEQQTSIGVVPLPVGFDDANALARAAALKSHWLVAGTARSEADEKFSIELKLYDATAGKMVWRTETTGELTAAESVGQALAGELLGHVTFETPAAKE
jgi:hypothetical protein